jgi:predicted transcriptional regulator of viral defense system
MVAASTICKKQTRLSGVIFRDDGFSFFPCFTTQVPHSVSVAVPRKSHQPSLDYPPVSVHRFSDMAFRAGIEEHQIDKVPVKIYSPEKTLADCFVWGNGSGISGNPLDFSFPTLYFRMCA